ncbi:MAG: ISAs1 family transposase [Caldilineaceae bacterium SB0661_bin_34]|nr:ISAs1 family transposase [Caldilineaceae bacterium SB0661_bin_34]
MSYIVACPDPELLETLCAFADHLATLPDPRDPRGVRHPLCVLLATLLVALAGGANSMAAVAAFTHDHRAWFRLWLPLGDPAPSRDTYLRLVRRLDPETAMKAALWLLDGTSLPGLQLVLALDGKVARRSGARAAGLRPLHLVSAFLVREGLTVAQEPYDRKSNEIAALPSARPHPPAGGRGHDRRRRLPDGHRAGPAGRRRRLRPGPQAQPGPLHREVKAAFDDADRGAFTPEVEDRCEIVEHNGGRRERRTGTVLGGPGLCEWVADAKAWPGLRSLVRVQAERTGPRGRRQRSVRYCISSCPPQAEALLALVRGHWGVENGLHRTLAVPFREDDCRMRTGHAPAVMAILRRAALNMLRTIQRKRETDVSIGLLRDRIGRQPWILAAALP